MKTFSFHSKKYEFSENAADCLILSAITSLSFDDPLFLDLFPEKNEAVQAEIRATGWLENGRFLSPEIEKYFSEGFAELSDKSLITKVFQFKNAQVDSSNALHRGLLEHMNRSSDSLLKIAKSEAVFAGDFTTSLQLITEDLSKKINVNRVSVWSYDKEENLILCRDLYEKDKNAHSEGVILYGKDFPGYFKALELDEIIRADNAHIHHRTCEFSEVYLKPLNIFSMLDVPFYIQGEIGGVICFEHTGDFRTWEQSDILYTSAMSAVISVAYLSLLRKEGEIKISESNQQLLVQNEELQQQQEEIMAQRDFIDQTNHDLETINQRLQAGEKVLKRAYSDIQEKSKFIDNQNHLISTSIRAAKNIQEALLPQKSETTAMLGEHFLIFRPKDVVSGDFYRISRIAVDKTILVVADCTGHGVPGAFMSLIGQMLCMQILEILLSENPAEILEILHTELHKILRQDITGDSNGMDAAVLLLEKTPNGETKCTFSGAKIPMHYYRQKEFLYLKPTRRALGGVQNETKSFENQSVTLSKGDKIFLGSDGLVDVCNPERESFGTKKMREILSKNAEKSCPEVGQILEAEIDNFADGTPQRDDILMIGFTV